MHSTHRPQTMILAVVAVEAREVSWVRGIGHGVDLDIDAMQAES